MGAISQLAMLLFAPGFHGKQTALSPAGPQARTIEHTFLLIFWITAIVYVIVIAVLAVGVWRARTHGNELPPPQAANPVHDRLVARIVAGALGVSIILLFIMLVSSYRTSHATAALAASSALTINVYGHQWWWEVEYPNKEPYKIVHTANEIHVPAGVPVTIHATSRDVIHSFWAPNIHGKKDLLPGYFNDLTLEVDQPGNWRGQCAEFCGEQHAHMSFEIVAQSPQDFQRWLSAQALSAPGPTTPQIAHGQQVFLSHPCVMCHTIGGTTANSRVGPDLTHLASRSTIAAGTLPNTIGNLAGWISNPQSIKPGCRMPPNPMSSTDLNDLLAYLETLR